MLTVYLNYVFGLINASSSNGESMNFIHACFILGSTRHKMLINNLLRIGKL